METRSNIFLVSAVVGALVLALLVVIIWLARPAQDETLHQILFDSSVEGLRPGSAVTLSGVTVGSVRSVSLVPGVPGQVRVVVSLNETAASAPGLEASISSSFITGEGQVTLQSSRDHGRRGIYADLSGVPTIPASEAGGLLSGNARQTIERVTRGINELNDSLTPAAQARISADLARFERRSADFAADAPRLADNIRSARRQVERYAGEAERLGRQAGALDRQLREGGAAPLRSVRESLARARLTLGEVDAGVGEARQSVSNANRQIEEATEGVRNVRADVDPVRRAVERVEREGLGDTPDLPDYEPNQ